MLSYYDKLFWSHNPVPSSKTHPWTNQVWRCCINIYMYSFGRHCGSRIPGGPGSAAHRRLAEFWCRCIDFMKLVVRPVFQYQLRPDQGEKITLLPFSSGPVCDFFTKELRGANMKSYGLIYMDSFGDCHHASSATWTHWGNQILVTDNKLCSTLLRLMWILMFSGVAKSSPKKWAIVSVIIQDHDGPCVSLIMTTRQTQDKESRKMLWCFTSDWSGKIPALALLLARSS